MSKYQDYIDGCVEGEHEGRVADAAYDEGFRDAIEAALKTVLTEMTKQDPSALVYQGKERFAEYCIRHEIAGELRALANNGDPGEWGATSIGKPLR